jgi:hypothetical protein
LRPAVRVSPRVIWVPLRLFGEVGAERFYRVDVREDEVVDVTGTHFVFCGGVTGENFHYLQFGVTPLLSVLGGDGVTVQRLGRIKEMLGVKAAFNEREEGCPTGALDCVLGVVVVDVRVNGDRFAVDVPDVSARAAAFSHDRSLHPRDFCSS